MTETPSQSKGRSTSGRVDVIDLLRGWAVIVMIETHVFNATLSNDLTSTKAFQYINFVNGLVAPSFLFASGLAYAVTAHRKIGTYLALGAPLFKQLSRLLLVLFIAYALHIPIFPVYRLLTEATEAQQQSFFQVDILQCIAVTLLSLQLMLLLLRTERRLYRTTLILGVLIILSTPWMWGFDFWTLVPWPIAAYLNGLRHSLFPLFPWSAFLFAGALTGFYFVRAREAKRPEGTGGEESMMRSLLWVGGSAILLSIAIEPIASSIFPNTGYWWTSPSFFLLRLGIVMLLLGGMYFATRVRGVSRNSVVTLIGRESLFVYVLHLLLIFGKFEDFNFKDEAGQSFGYLEASIATAILLLLMYGTARTWSRIKANSPRLKLALNLLTLGIVVGVLLFGEGE